MILVDTSAWVELLRATGSPVDVHLQWLLRQEAPLAVTEVVVGELLSGAVNEQQALALRSRLLSFPLLPLGGLAGFEAAARLFRSARSRGVTVRRYADCCVAVPALRIAATVLHADRDFDHLARVTPLQVEPVP